jgi:hypothetical protein
MLSPVFLDGGLLAAFAAGQEFIDKDFDGALGITG